MRYVISDIHGCYQEFLRLLEVIRFSDTDELYLLGDMVDRGPEPIPLLLDVMARPNVIPILGNHDYMALSVLKKLNVEITEENAETHLSADDMLSWLHWTQDGGTTTARQFSALDPWTKEDVLDYLMECSLYEEVHTGGRHYILVHAGIEHFEEERELDDYDISDFLFFPTDYQKRYFSDPNTFLVTGHTPTMHLHQDKRHEIYQENGHIAVDCGCVFGGQLAAYCFETQQCYYVECEGE